MAGLAQSHGVRTRALLTSMHVPTGAAVGNFVFGDDNVALGTLSGNGVDGDRNQASGFGSGNLVDVRGRYVTQSDRLPDILEMRKRGIDPMASGIGPLILLNLAITFIPGFNISIGGHIGGLVGGVIVTLILFELRDHLRVSRNVPLFLAAGVGVLAIVGSIAVA